LTKKEAEEDLKRAENAGVLNIQLLVVRSLLHSPSSSECEKGKTYNEKMQFAHMIIQDIYRFETFAIEFLHKCKKGWSSREQVGPKAALVDLMNIEKSYEDKGVEQQSVETQVAQKDAKEEEVYKVGVQPSTKV
jgi:hypothetical protein